MGGASLDGKARFASTHTTTYGYDTENNLTSITDANGNETMFTYDAYGRVTQTSFPSTHSETYQYDANDNLTSKTDRKGQTITYSYDQANRLVQKTYADSTAVAYTYDLDSRLTHVTDPTGTYTFVFDNMGRLTSATSAYSFLSGHNFTSSYTYDAASNRAGYTAPDGSTNTYSYDTLNRLSSLANSWAGTFGFSYDALSRRTQMTKPNSITTNYSYDSLSRLLSVLHQSGGSTLDGATYTVDAAGNRTSKEDWLASVTSNYTYDAIYQLTQVTQGSSTTESYSYDPVGNRTASLGVSSYTTNSSNELTATSNASYAYDTNGNTTSKTTSGNTTSYSWDFENRLTSVILPGSGGTVSFKYDPFGRRIYKSSSSGTSIFAYDGDNLVEEANSSGTEVASYSQGMNIDEPLAMVRSSTNSFYEADGLGSVTSLSSGAGALAQTYTLDSFGKQTAATGSLTNPFQYTARESDTETGLYFYCARYYDQTIGRFASEDPVGFRGGINFYRYANNNPPLLRDPSGRACWGGGLSGAAAFAARWVGAGAEGSFYFVGDSAGNQGVLDCRGLGPGAVSGLGGSVSLQGSGIVSPNCTSICQLEGTFGGYSGFAGAGLTKSVSGSATVSNTSATFTAGGGYGVGAGAGLVLIGGDCTLIWRHHNCPSCTPKKR